MSHHKRSLVVLALTIFAAAFGWPLHAAAATYYVAQTDPQASDANPGSELLPWLTVRRATEVAQAGDLVLVKHGRYSDPGATHYRAFNPVRSGTATAPIRLRSEPRGAAVLVAPARDKVAIGIFQRAHIVLDGFKAEGQVKIEQSQFVTIENFEVLYGSTQGADPTLNWGIAVVTASENSIRHNYVHRLLSSGDHSHNTAGIMVGFDASRNVIENNYVDAGRVVFSAFGQKGRDIRSNVWRRNVAKNAQAGFLGMGSTDGLSYSSANSFYENLIVHCTAAFLLDHNAEQFQIYNNTAYAVVHFLYGGFLPDSSSGNRNTTLWNNIAVQAESAYTRDPASVNWSILIAESDYNNYNVARVAAWDYGRSGYRTLAEWRSATGLDQHSFSANPLFVDVSSDDFRLAEGSPSRGTGRDGADMGAFPTRTEVIGPAWRPGNGLRPAAPRAPRVQSIQRRP